MRSPRALWMLVLVAAGCRAYEVVPETGRRRLALRYSQSEMAAAGARAYAEVLSRFDVVEGTEEARMVERVSRRVIAVTGRDCDWEVKLLDAPKNRNAFCLPGGKIAVCSGILPIARSEDGLAVVLSHEVAHATLQHGNERMSQPRIRRLLGRPLQLITDTWGLVAPGTRRLAMDALGLGAIFGRLLPYSQEHETEADDVGLRYMREAGFDVDEAPRFWRRMAAASPDGTTDSIRTHPDPEKRAKRLEEQIRQGR